MHFLLAALLTAAAPSPADWPAYRGPHADGRSEAKNLPTEWSETKNVRWKVPVHGKGWSSPIVIGDRVWVTTADEEGGGKVVDSVKGTPRENPVTRVTFFALCFDLKTGKLIHDIALRSESKPPYCHPFNSYASSTPAAEPGRVYAHFGSHGTFCVDADSGKVLWERTDLKCDHFRGPASSPTLFGDKLYLILDGADQQYVVALDKATGQTRWKADRNIKYKTDNGDYKKAYGTPAVLAVNGKPQLICPSAECTIAYDPDTGAELWRLTHGGMNVSTLPLFGHGLMYLTSGHTAQLLAVKQGVSGAVPADAVAWESKKGVPTRPSMLLVGDLLFMVSDNGIASCVDAKTGKPHWSERLDGEYSASPLYSEGKVYLFNQVGKAYVLEASAEYTPVAESKLDGGCMASPAAVGDTLLVRTKTHLYAIGKK